MLITVIIVATLSLAREVLLPIALACILSFMLAPPVRMLQNRRVPRGLAVAAVVLLAFFAIFMLGSFMARQVSRLAKDLPRVWHAPTTQAKDRKRMLRLLIKDITVEKPPLAKQLLAHIRWQGGACSDIRVQLPPNIADRVRYPATVVDRVRHLAQSLPDGEIADRLNQEGQVSALGKPFTGSMIQWIRYRHQIPKARLIRPEELTVQQVAERFRISPNVVYYWIDRGIIRARRLNAGSPYWITLSETDEHKLRDWVHNSCRIQMTSSTRLVEGAL